MPANRAKAPKTGIFILSAVLAALIVVVFVPTPNTVDGGGIKMVLIIFLAVAFKATIEYFWNRRLKQKNDKREDKPVS